MPHQSRQLRQYRGVCRSAYAKSERPYEQRVEYAVEHHRENSGIHGMTGLAGRTQAGVHAKVKMRNDVAYQYHLHIVAGIDYCLVAGTEEAQYGVEEQHAHDAEKKSDNDIQRNGVAKDVLRCLIILLPELHRHQRRRSHSYGCSEGRGKVHEGEGDGES